MMRYRPLGATPDDPRLGRLVPDDWEHVERHPLSALRPAIVPAVEHTLTLPSWHWTHDQGREGSCVGHGGVMERAIVNLAQNRAQGAARPTRRYDPLWLWDHAKTVDDWPDTNPGDDNGTSVRAAYDVLRASGPRPITARGISLVNGVPVVSDQSKWQDPREGVSAFRWATTVDEIRTAIAGGVPVTIGVNWYSAFDDPVGRPGAFGRPEYWIGSGQFGYLRGGHCVCMYGASDRRQAFKLKNSWGRDYPLTWLTYGAMQTLLDEDGEAAVATDR